jgi:ParB-like nuclease domain
VCIVRYSFLDGGFWKGAFLMVVEAGKTPVIPPARPELVPRYFDTKLLVSPEGNPTYTPAMLADLVASIKEHGQMVPGWVYPSPDLLPEKRVVLEGNRRMGATDILGIPFWAFDLGRFVPEAERIVLMFHHHECRRTMSLEEIAERGGRYMELTGCTAAEAAKQLNVSAVKMSRAFGERRIPAELWPKAEKLVQSVRSLIAATPAPLMPEALEFAHKFGADGKPVTRDQVSLFIQQLKAGGKPPRKAKTVTLHHAGRTVTISLNQRDSAATVAADLKAIAAKLGGQAADVSPDGWKFFFQGGAQVS